MRNKYLVWVFLGGLLFILTACQSSFVKTEQPSQVDFFNLSDEVKIGQSFLSRYDGLNGIILYLLPASPGNGKITLRLRDEPNSSETLRTTSISLTEIDQPGQYLFSFEPIVGSNLKRYTYTLSLQGSGSVQVGYSYANAYLNGSAYINNEPYEAQVLFKLSYLTRQALLGILHQSFEWAYWLLLSLLILILPGWAILSILYPKWQQSDWLTRLSLTAGISISVYPLFMLWTHLFGLNLGYLNVCIPLVISLVALVIHYWRRRKSARLEFPTWREIDPFTITSLIILFLILASRIWTIRSLAAPLWGDSYQHSLITQLIIDNHGLFQNWQPYAELETFTYHFGFHSVAAAFNWLAGIPIEKAILWVGQVMNALACIALYPLTVRISKNRWAGLLAVLLSGLLFSMPMVYMNWGRYTQLAGQVILITFVYLSWDLLEPDSPSRNLYPIVWISLTGLALTHYRILVFALMFLMAYFMIYQGWKRRSEFLKKFAVIGLGSFVLFLPWFINLFSGKLASILKFQLATTAGNSSLSAQQTNSIGDLSVYLPTWAWVIIPLVIGWGLWRRRPEIGLISLWWYLILLAANPGWLFLPGTGVMTNFAVFIAAYIPASILISTGIYWLYAEVAVSFNAWQANRSKNVTLPKNLLSYSVILLVLAIGILGAKKRLSDVNPAQFALLTYPDLTAMEWIQQNLSDKSAFLVNSIPAYSNSLIAGGDGGWWLPLITQRQSSLPPLNYGAERGPRPDYREWINQLTVEIQSKGIDHPDVIQELSRRGITHIYVGQQQGLVNSGTPLIKLEQIINNPNFQPVYHRDRVWIFELVEASQ